MAKRRAEQTRQTKPSAESTHRPGRDPIIEMLMRDSIPVTRENYLRHAYPPHGLPEPLPAELEAALPEELRINGGG